MAADFQEDVLRHLDAAYNLARWLTKDERAAEDAVQDSLVRALKSIGGFRGGDSRAWVLAIVRNACYSWLSKHRREAGVVELDEELDLADAGDADPAAIAARNADAEAVRAAIERLPPEFREVIVLRELESLSYQEVAEVAGVPIGTVMSRLSRARKRLKQDMTSSARGGRD